MSPTTKTVTHGSSVTFSITLNTGGQPVNAVQIYLSFPDARLDCSSIAPTSAMPGVAAKTCNTSTAEIVVYTPGGTPPVEGTLKVATVSLKTTSVKGKAVVSFDRSRTIVAQANENVDILGTTNTATITVK